MKNTYRSGYFCATVVFIAIGLMQMPSYQVNAQTSDVTGNPAGDSTGKGISVRNVNAVIVDNDNVKWFSTDVGIVSFNGKYWKLHNENKNLPTQDLKGITYSDGPGGPALWVASPAGATVVRLPIDDTANAVTYQPESSPILGKDVVGIAAGKDSVRWIGTEKGISALCGDRWLAPYYDLVYPERMFKVFPITSMATNPKGDTLYVATEGAGIVRVYRDDLDAISGASVYAQWGPIILPSDNVLSIYIAPDGSKWFGTKKGIARHTGNNTLDNWTVYNKNDGLVDNCVQAICGDNNGHIWFGTKGGISVFDSSSWISYTTENGLASNNILSIAIDHEGIVWIGTDVGITSFRDGAFTNY